MTAKRENMKTTIKDALDAMSYFLAGTFLLQILLDPRLANLPTRNVTAIRWFGYGFIIVGILLSLVSILVVFKANIVNKGYDHAQRWLRFPLFLVTLCAVVVSGLLVGSYLLMIIMFFLVSFTFLWYALIIIGSDLKRSMKSLNDLGKLLVVAGIPFLWIRFVGLIFQVALPFEGCLLAIGIGLLAIGGLLILIGSLVTHSKEESERARIKDEQKYQLAEGTEFSGLLVDEPIRTPGQDRLSRAKFAESVAQMLFLHSDPSCLITALTGPWGSGKSSLLNLIEHNLRAKSSTTSRIMVIRFNPWNIASLDQLTAMFFQELKVAVQGKEVVNELTNKTVKLLNVFSGILSVGGFSPVGSQYFSLGAEAAGRASATIRESQNKSLAEIKGELDGLLFKTAKRIFILIDDIDRLDQDSVKLLFRMIRLNADFRNTTYLLAFDPKIVEGLLDAEQHAHGKEYLEKIVQLPISIPAADEAIIREILGRELNNLIAKYGEARFDTKRWEKMVTSGDFFKYFRTLRDVVRYTNGLKINYALVSNNVNMVDFMAVEAIRIFAGESHDAIRRNKSLLTRLNTDSGLHGQRENVGDTKKVLSQIFDPKRGQQALSEEARRADIVQATCRVLFPQLDRIYGGGTYDTRSEQSWRQQKRICAKEIFDNYFLLGVPKGEISDEEMRIILAQSNDHLSLKKALDELFDRGLGQRFLELVEDYLECIQSECIEETILSLFETEDKIISVRRVMLDIGADTRAARVIYLLLKRIEGLDAKRSVIENAVKRSTKIFLPVYTVSFITPDKNERDSTRGLQELDFSLKEVDELRKLCVQKIEEFADSGMLSKSPQLGMVLFRWLDWGDKSKVKTYVKTLVETDEGVLDLLIGLSSEVLSGSGRYTRIDRSHIAEFIDINLIETKVNDKIRPKASQFNPRQKEALEAYLRSGTQKDNNARKRPTV